MKMILNQGRVTTAFLWVSPTVTLRPDWPINPLSEELKMYFTLWLCASSTNTLPSCVIYGETRPLPRSTARHFEPNYKYASGCWRSNGEGWSLTCMASISSVTAMSGFTLAVNCPPLGSLVSTCWILSFFFFPFLSPH